MNSIRLRPIRPEDVDWIHRACQDSDIQRWTTVPRPYTRSHAQSFVGDTTLEYQRWVIETVRPDEPLGLVSIHGVRSGDADIGYWVAPWGRGRGVGTTAVQSMIENVRNHGDISRLVAYVAAENVASQSVVRRAGFIETARQEGPACRDLQPVTTIVFQFGLVG